MRIENVETLWHSSRGWYTSAEIDGIHTTANGSSPTKSIYNLYKKAGDFYIACGIMSRSAAIKHALDD